MVDVDQSPTGSVAIQRLHLLLREVNRSEKVGLIQSHSDLIEYVRSRYVQWQVKIDLDCKCVFLKFDWFDLELHYRLLEPV